MTEALTPEQKAGLEEVRRLRFEGIRAAKARRASETEALYWQALHLHEETMGAEHPSIAESLGPLIYEYGRNSRHAEAEPLIERSLTLLRRKPGPEHRGVLQTLDGLASHHADRGRDAEAEPYYLRVLAAREELVGPNHPRVAGTLVKYAALLSRLGREAAAAALERAEAIRRPSGTIGKRNVHDHHPCPRTRRPVVRTRGA